MCFGTPYLPLLAGLCSQYHNALKWPVVKQVKEFTVTHSHTLWNSSCNT